MSATSRRHFTGSPEQPKMALPKPSIASGSWKNICRLMSFARAASYFCGKAFVSSQADRRFNPHKLIYNWGSNAHARQSDLVHSVNPPLSNNLIVDEHKVIDAVLAN